MKILISGGGIGGLTLAYWLSEYGNEVKIIEKAQEYRRTGFSLNLIGKCLSILSDMGLDEQLKRHRIDVNVNNLMNLQGKLVRKDDISELNTLGKLGIFLRRADLHTMLWEAIKDRSAINMGRSIKELSADHNLVTVTFEDGKEETCDLLIGADGVHSTVRKLIFGEGFEKLLNVVYAAFTTENRYGLPQEAFNLSGPNRVVGLTGISSEEISALFWYKMIPENSLSSQSKLTYLIDQFQDFGWVVKDVIRDIRSKDSSTLFCDYATQIHLPNWHKGRVALIGDAAHCLSPISLRGAGMAIEGAYVLAECLRDAPDYQTAFENYEKKLRRIIDQLQSLAHKNIEMMLPGSEFSLRIRNFFIKLMPARVMKQLIVKQFATETTTEEIKGH